MGKFALSVCAFEVVFADAFLGIRRFTLAARHVDIFAAIALCIIAFGILMSPSVIIVSATATTVAIPSVVHELSRELVHHLVLLLDHSHDIHVDWLSTRHIPVLRIGHLWHPIGHVPHWHVLTTLILAHAIGASTGSIHGSSSVCVDSPSMIAPNATHGAVSRSIHGLIHMSHHALFTASA